MRQLAGSYLHLVLRCWSISIDPELGDALREFQASPNGGGDYVRVTRVRGVN
jgi:hypothetical protein